MKTALTENERLDRPSPVPGPFRIEEQISEGTLTKVWRATNLSTGEAVCIKHPNYDTPKIKREDKLRYFEREINSLKECTSLGGHPNIVDYIDDFQVDDLRLLVVSLVDGENLSERIKRTGPYADFDVVRNIGEQICDAVQFLHRTEHVNRDIKPSNIVTTLENEVVLIDFNTVKRFDPNADIETSITNATEIQGPFKPPEVAGQDTSYPQGPWSDVYSIGKLLAFLLTGKRIIDSDIDLSSRGGNCSDEMATIIRRATSTDPTDRYTEPSEMRQALRSDSSSGGTETSDTRKATLVFEGRGTEFTIRPGDTLGRDDGSATIAVSGQNNQPVSSVHVEFDVDETGAWVLYDRSTNGTYVRSPEPDAEWLRVISQSGRRKLEAQGHDMTRSDGTYPPESVRLPPETELALVGPRYDFHFTFLPAASDRT